MKIYLFRKIVFNCKQATLLSLKKEGKSISVPERIKLLYHLLFCDSCRNFIKQSSLITRLGKDVIDSIFANPPHTLSPKIKESLQQQLNAGDQ